MATAGMDSLIGKTLRWTFADGPVAGKTYEHTFNADGSVEYRGIDGAVKGAPTHKKECATVKLADGIFVISCLSASGYTLTVAPNFHDHRMVGFASSSKEWYRQQGTFDVVPGGG